VTTPFGGPARTAPGLPNLPTPPTGWPVGSYATYEEAQRAVDHLADSDFPVRDVTIVGVDLMLVERVIGRLTWGRVLVSGAASGAWFGLFVGLLLSLFSPAGTSFGPILVGLASGIVFGLVFAAVGQPDGGRPLRRPLPAAQRGEGPRAARQAGDGHQAHLRSTQLHISFPSRSVPRVAGSARRA
jgi:hypothetical protein